MVLDVQIKEIEALSEGVRELLVRLEKMERKLYMRQLWYGREDLAALKGMKVSAFYNKPWLLPGEPSRQGGNERWSYAQVWESGWIWKSDKELQSKGARRGHD